jgi:hypothetical protein
LKVTVIYKTIILETHSANPVVRFLKTLPVSIFQKLNLKWSSTIIRWRIVRGLLKHFFKFGKKTIEDFSIQRVLLLKRWRSMVNSSNYDCLKNCLKLFSQLSEIPTFCFAIISENSTKLRQKQLLEGERTCQRRRWLV